ncbi:hypothetical protein Ocin01_10290 [Orchesella cincta]|uniref:Uncharacterized protein n=1 Tax=Orchesella cincta TaxID=48709 RepID=A0A1D2MTL8_ORCCI|nr:hypothetical protein Ocin01_10290 [Orchesella cincta]
MLNRSLFLFGAVICAVYMTVFVDCGGGHGDKAQWMEKMSKCGEGEKINMEETMKYKKECKDEVAAKKKPASEDEESMERRRRSPEERQGGKHSKGKGRGGKGGRRGHGKKLAWAVCTWKKSGMLNQDDGKFNEDGCKKYIDAVYPESKRDTAFEKMKKCNTDHGSTFSEENDCAGYGNFSRCIMNAHMTTCGLEMPNWGGKGGGKGKGKKPQPQNDEDEDME